MSEATLLTSTGHYGVSEERPDGSLRWYLNAADRFNDVSDLVARWEEHRQQSTLTPAELGRVVLRGEVTDEVLEAIKTDPLSDILEAALPLEEFGRPDTNFVSLGQNGYRRQSSVSIQEILEGSIDLDTADILLKRTPLQRVDDTLNSGNTIDTLLAESDYDGLHQLWGPVFGWTRNEQTDQIAALGQRLSDEQLLPDDERTVWFAAVHNAAGTIISAAMAERLDGPINKVESTEWARLPGFDGQSFTAAALSVVHAQVLRDLKSSPKGPPVIYAETNYRAGAHNFGASVGLTIPSRRLAKQILLQNVAVGDGCGAKGLRDFIFMYLSTEAQQLYYDSNQINDILEGVDATVSV